MFGEVGATGQGRWMLSSGNQWQTPCVELEAIVSFQTFPRGPGPLCTVLLPTRGRPKMLCESIDSLHSLAKDKTLVEFILKIDDDDSATLEILPRLSALLPLKAIVSPRGNGYHDIHNWVNQMSSLAKGDWLLLWNDDARMKTDGWDQTLMTGNAFGLWHGVTDVCLLCARTIGRENANEFVILRRATFELLGHFSRSPHTDNWLWNLMSFVNSAFTCPIEVDHLSAEIDDDVRRGSQDAYKTTIHTLNSVDAVQLRLNDAQRLVDYIRGERGKRLHWEAKI